METTFDGARSDVKIVVTRSLSVAVRQRGSAKQSDSSKTQDGYARPTRALPIFSFLWGEERVCESHVRSMESDHCGGGRRAVSPKRSLRNRCESAELVMTVDAYGVRS